MNITFCRTLFVFNCWLFVPTIIDSNATSTELDWLHRSGPLLYMQRYAICLSLILYKFCLTPDHNYYPVYVLSCSRHVVRRSSPDDAAIGPYSFEQSRHHATIFYVFHHHHQSPSSSSLFFIFFFFFFFPLSLPSFFLFLFFFFLLLFFLFFSTLERKFNPTELTNLIEKKQRSARAVSGRQTVVSVVTEKVKKVKLGYIIVRPKA